MQRVRSCPALAIAAATRRITLAALSECSSALLAGAPVPPAHRDALCEHLKLHTLPPHVAAPFSATSVESPGGDADVGTVIAQLQRRVDVLKREAPANGAARWKPAGNDAETAAAVTDAVPQPPMRAPDAPALLLAAVAGGALQLFCPLARRVVLTVPLNFEAIFDPFSMIQVFEGTASFVLIPVDDTREGPTAAATRRFVAFLVSCGIPADAQLTLRDLMQVLGDIRKARNSRCSPPPPNSDEFFRKFESGSPDWGGAWATLSSATRECRFDLDGAAGTTLDALTLITMTRGEVFCINIVSAGARTVHLALYNVRTDSRRSASGTLHDILSELLSIPSSSIILVPTAHTDRDLLFACRTAMCRRRGVAVQIVFPANLGSEKGLQFVAERDATKLPTAVTKLAGWSSANEFAWRVRVACAALLREQLTSSESFINNKHMFKCSTPPVLVSSSVSDYLSLLWRPERCEAESSMAAQVSRRVCVIGVYTAGVSDYRRFDNPLITSNYVAAAAFLEVSAEGTEKEAATLGATLSLCLPLQLARNRAQQAALPDLDGIDTLVANDAKHVLLFYWRDPNLQAFLRRGGRVWCTMLSEYLLTGQRAQFPHNTLEHTASTYGYELASAAGRGGADSRDGSRFKPVHNVIRLHAQMQQELEATKTVFFGQVERALRQSQMISLAHRMDALLALTSMESSGIHLNRTVVEELILRERNEVAAVENMLQNYVPSSIPLDMQRYFSWSSPAHLEAFFFGGTVRLAMQDADLTSNAASVVLELLFAHGLLDRWSNQAEIISYARENGLAANAHDIPTQVMPAVREHLRQIVSGGGSGSSNRIRFRIVVFDIESTGLNSDDEIIELCFIDPVTGDRVETLVNPGRGIPPSATDIHRITDAMVAKAPKIEQVVPELLRFLRLTPETAVPNERVLLVAHFVKGIDMPLLRRAVHRVHPHFRWEHVAFVDSLDIFRQHPSERFRDSLKLSELVREFQVEPRGALHRAEVDVWSLWDVLVAAFAPGEKHDAARAHTSVLHAIASNVAENPRAHCMSAAQREHMRSASVSLPGEFADFFKNDKRGATFKKMRKDGVQKSTLEAFAECGCMPAKLLLRTAELTKSKGGLLDTDAAGKLVYVHEEDSCVHQEIGMWSTTTSRTISTSPCAQSIPKDSAAPLRRGLCSRYGARGFTVEIDFKQLEIAIMAILCNDAALLRDLRSGVDFHARRVPFFKPGLTYEAVMERLAAKDPEMIAMRRKAKTVSFQRLYGGGIDIISKTTKLPKDVVQRLVDEEDAMYPGIKKYHELVRAVGLRADNPGLPSCYMFELPTGCRMAFSHQDITKNLPPVKNYPIQGYGAEIVQAMLGRVFRRFAASDFCGQRAHLVNFVHDSVWMDVHEDVVERAVRECAMELSSASVYIQRAFPGVAIGMPLGVTAEYGRTMSELRDVPQEWLQSP